MLSKTATQRRFCQSSERCDLGYPTLSLATRATLHMRGAASARQEESRAPDMRGK
jgi:hypothetical protein